MSQHQYHPHQSRGLQAKQVTLIHQRCPITEHLMKPGEGNVTVMEHLGRKGKPIGRRASVRVATQITPYDYSQWRKRHNVQVVHG